MAQRVILVDDLDGTDHGYKLHMIYGALASPSEKARTTINESPEATPFSWTATTTPIAFPAGSNFKPTAHIVADSTKMSAQQLTDLEELLYGNETSSVEFPTPAELLELFTP